jgi:hypothetical protein
MGALACAESFYDTMLDGCGNGTDGNVGGMRVSEDLWSVMRIRIRLLGHRIPNPVPGPEKLKQPAKNDENKGITRFEELNVLPQGTKNSPEAGSSSDFRKRLRTHQKAWIQFAESR